MTALIAILFLTVATLVTLRLVAPRPRRSAVGRCEFAAAVALPVLATFAHFYVLFAAGLVVIIIGFPAMFGGAVGRQARLEQQVRLGCFALPLLPIFYLDVSVSSFTVAQLSYVILICGILAGAMLASGLRLPNGRLATWDITFAALMLAQLFMDARGTDLLFLLRSILHQILTLGLPYFVFSRAIAISTNPSRHLLALILATAVIAVMAVFESTRSWLLYSNMNIYVGANPDIISGYSKWRGGMLRPGATWGDSTSLSLFFGVTLVMVYALRREIGSRGLVWVLAGLLAAGVFITFARVGYLALVVGLAACLIHERRYGRLALLAGAVPLAAFGLVALAAVLPIVASSIGVSSDSTGTVDYREMLIRDGLALWRSNWLVGVTVPEITAGLAHLRQGEGIVDLVNQPLTTLMRGGVIFASLYYAMTIRLLAALLTRRRRMDKQARAIASAAFAGTLALLAGLLTTSYLRNDSTFVILLAIGTGTVVRRTATASRPSPAVAAPAFASARLGTLQRSRPDGALSIAEPSPVRT